MLVVLDFVELGDRGPVDVVVDEEAGTCYILVQTGMSEHDIARETSIAISRHGRESWMYVGALADAEEAA